MRFETPRARCPAWVCSATKRIMSNHGNSSRFYALTKEGTWRKQVTKTLGVALRTGGRETTAEVLYRAGAVSLARAKYLPSRWTGLPAPALTGEDAHAIEALSRVLEAAAAELHVEFSNVGKVDYTYVSGAARVALTEEGEPTDLGLRAGLKLPAHPHRRIPRHVDRAVRAALCADGGLGAGRRPHAIRGGRPDAVDLSVSRSRSGAVPACGGSGVGTVPVEPLQLTRWFRSSPSLVEWTEHSVRADLPTGRRRSRERGGVHAEASLHAIRVMSRFLACFFSQAETGMPKRD